jgi:hypothetical protein
MADMAYNGGKTGCHVYHPPVITIFGNGGMFTIPSHGWFMIVLATL